MILNVVRAGWIGLKRDRAALILSFVVPIVFFSIFAGIFGAMRDTTSRVELAIVDEDQTVRSRRLVAGLKKESALKVVEETKRGPLDRGSAEEYVRSGDGPVALIIPKDFGASEVRFGPPGTSSQPELLLLADRSDPIAPQIVNGLLQKVTMTALPDVFIGGGVEALDRWSGGLTAQQRAEIDRNVQSMRGFTENPSAGSGGGLVNVKVQDVMGEDHSAPLIAFYAAGIGVMFLLFTATGAGGALLEESENGTLDRILTTRVSMTQLLLGKLAYLTTLGVVQLVVMFIWGMLVFKLDLIPHLPGFAVMTIVTALACSAFGLVLASLSRTRAQLGAISTLIVLTISALGGSMFPRFLMPKGMQKASLVAFNSWALDGFLKVFWREEPLLALWPQVLFLLGTTIVFFALARRFVRRLELV